MSATRWTARRKWGAVIAGIVVLGVVGGLWWWRHRAPEGFIIDVRALEDGSAVVVWRLNPDHGEPREWIAHFDDGGTLAWRSELPGLSMRGALVIGDLVTIRYAREREKGQIDQAVAAYALRDGHLVWDVVLISVAGNSNLDVPSPFFPAFSAGGKLIEQVIERDEHASHVLYAIDPSSGQILGHANVAASPEPFGPLVVGDRLVLHESGAKVNIVDTSHGVRVTDVEIGGGGSHLGCVVGEDYVAVAREGRERALVAFHLGDPASRHVLAQPFPAVDGETLSFSKCGHHGSGMVFEVTDHLVPPGDPKTSIAVTDPNGRVIAMIAMPFTSSFERGYLMWPPESIAFSGALSRFVPYLSLDGTKEHEQDKHLAMVDLEQARVAWLAPKAFDLADEIFHAGDRWYLNNSVTGGDVIAFDGTTGQLIAAINGGDAIQPWHVAGGKLWLYSKAWGRLDEAPLAVLDAKTLAPLLARGIEITDVTARVRGELASP